MSTKTRRGLSYVIGDTTDNENHILPINAIQFSARTNKFYTGGRDGTVKSWSCENSWERSVQGTPSQFSFKDQFENAEDSSIEEEDLNERILKLETCISSNPLSYTNTQYENYGITNNYNIHFDWVNDLALVNNDRDLVSCSSDLSLKLINLHSAEHTESYHIHKFPNVHTDYIKKLSYIGTERLMLSGGLDGRVVIWDLNTLKASQKIHTQSTVPSSPNSIYSLASNNSHVICTGGPSNTISLYDKRMNTESNFIKMLVGHQDNIRSLLMNDTFILSGSSDTTIKLWDLRNFKVYKNFDIHDDAVWCLSTDKSSSPGIIPSTDSDPYNDFTVFFSGDKSGNIMKSDLSCLSFNQDVMFKHNLDVINATDERILDEKAGVSTLLAQTGSPVVSLCSEADAQMVSKNTPTLLASTEQFLGRYHIPDTSNLAQYQYLRLYSDFINSYDQNNETTAMGLSESPTDQADLNSDFYDLVSRLSIDSNGFDLQSSFSGPNYPVSVHNVDAITQNETIDDKEYKSMFRSVLDEPLQDFVNLCPSEHLPRKPGKEEDDEEVVNSSPIDILLNPVPAENITLIPFNRKPFGLFPLIPKSIISKRLFNNKRHMLVLYLNGDIKIWDLFNCSEFKTFPYVLYVEECSKEVIEKRLKDMESLYQTYQTDDTLNNWCEVEIKSGKLLVTLKETSFNNVEIYYDDLCKSYPFLALDNSQYRSNEKLSIGDDDRLLLSRILINSLFHEYAIHEWNFDRELREALRIHKKKNRQLSNASNSGCTQELNHLADANEQSNVQNGHENSVLQHTAKRVKMFSRKSSKNSLALSQQLEQAQGVSDHSSESSQSSKSTSSYMTKFINNECMAPLGLDEHASNDDSIMHMLQFNKRRYWERYNSSDLSNVLHTLLKIYSNEPQFTTSESESQAYKPLIDSQNFPPKLLIIIFEHSPELGNLRDIFSFHYEDILKLKDNSKVDEPLVHDLRTYLPMWIGKLILYDSFQVKEYPKIEFLLMECDYTLLPTNRKIGGKSQKKIRRLPVSDTAIKLTSHSMLRVLKILKYLTEKFDSKTPEMKDRRDPHEWLVLECRDQELPNNLTLQTIKTKIWKKNSEIELFYRRKFDP